MSDGGTESTDGPRAAGCATPGVAAVPVRSAMIAYRRFRSLERHLGKWDALCQFAFEASTLRQLFLAPSLYVIFYNTICDERR